MTLSYSEWKQQNPDASPSSFLQGAASRKLGLPNLGVVPTPIVQTGTSVTPLPGLKNDTDGAASIDRNRYSWGIGNSMSDILNKTVQDGNTFGERPNPYPGTSGSTDSGPYLAPSVPETNYNPQTQWGHDPQYEAEMNRIYEQEANLRSQEELARRRMAEDTSLAQDEARRGRDDRLTANTESMADRGLVHSGINIQQQSDIGEDYIRVNDQIQRALSRGEEDLARLLASNYQQLEFMKGQLERERAERQAAVEAERAMRDAINAVPQPSVSGRYDLSGITPSSSAQYAASQGQYSNDAQYMSDGNALAQRIEQIFVNRNVPMYSQDQTDADRLARIVQEVSSGQRTLDDVRSSVDRIQRQMSL